MEEDSYEKEIKAIKLLQDRGSEISEIHSSIQDDLDVIKQQLSILGESDCLQSPDFHAQKDKYLREMSCENSINDVSDIPDIYQTAEFNDQEQPLLTDILTTRDLEEVRTNLDKRITDFNRRYNLDTWDYAIAGSCGLFAAMLDLLCVRAPQKPTANWSQEVDGIFNQSVQKAFNKILPPELSHALSKENLIGGPDSSVMTDLLGAPAKVLNPVNHRLRSIAHDPILGLIFGVSDMMNGTCTVINNGKIRTFPSLEGSTKGDIFQLLGKMFGHLLSDLNAPSSHGNRGMGLPAPFLGVLRMLDGVSSTDFSKEIEQAYVRGYDFRQFIVSSLPVTIMEVLLRAFYAIKQKKLYDSPLCETLLDTTPFMMNPKFRIMLALSYGTSSAVNAGKVYITQDVLNANYASWAGFMWNNFHALKWIFLDSHLKLWKEIEEKEIKEVENIIGLLDQLFSRANQLPTKRPD